MYTYQVHFCRNCSNVVFDQADMYVLWHNCIIIKNVISVPAGVLLLHRLERNPDLEKYYLWEGKKNIITWGRRRKLHSPHHGMILLLWDGPRARAPAPPPPKPSTATTTTHSHIIQKPNPSSPPASASSHPPFQSKNSSSHYVPLSRQPPLYLYDTTITIISDYHCPPRSFLVKT